MLLLWKSNYNIYIHFQVLYILRYIYNLGQAKNVLNITKSQHKIKTLYLFIAESFQNVCNFYFIHLRTNSRQHLQQQHLNSQSFVLWSKQISYCSPTFQLHLTFINATTISLPIIIIIIIIIYSWGKYLNYFPFIIIIYRK